MATPVTLLELNTLIAGTLRENLAGLYWVVAEVSEMKVNRTGHCYLELVEKNASTDEISARARATIWSYTFRMLRPYFETSTGQPFSEGIKILVQIMVEFHPVYGLSLNIKDIDPTYTLGDMARRRQDILKRLKEAGIYDMNRELPLPLVPQRIAVISSATAAGYLDFIHQLENNIHGFHFEHSLFEAYMQGTEAVPSILKALDAIFRDEEKFDAVAIIRGGGAQADLNCFDNFDLAFAVAQFPLPVVTGIGHEKDDTILDMIAHTRMKTPTAVAEFFISGLLRFEERLDELQLCFTDRARKIIEDYTDTLDELSERFRELTARYISARQILLNKTGYRFKNGTDRFINRSNVILYKYEAKLMKFPALMIRNKQHENSRLYDKIKTLVKSPLQAETLKINQLYRMIPQKTRNLILSAQKQNNRFEESLRHLDPENILLRGFSFALQKGKIVKSVLSISENEELETRFHDGSVFSKIKKK